jgi:hypothetical protein
MLFQLDVRLLTVVARDNGTRRTPKAIRGLRVMILTIGTNVSTANRCSEMRIDGTSRNITAYMLFAPGTQIRL